MGHFLKIQINKKYLANNYLVNKQNKNMFNQNLSIYLQQREQ